MHTSGVGRAAGATVAATNRRNLKLVKTG
jgi:hypothetical protein